MPPDNRLCSTGTEVDKIPVRMTYEIIELFSANLYSSPNKAFEELVANSYDAMAQSVAIVLPDDLENTNATIWVIDDGTAMGPDGMRQLWTIGRSQKRELTREASTRPPIGRFGIGKLATYVLAWELTHVCKRDRKYYAVTMDFEGVASNAGGKDDELELSVRKLTCEEARRVLAPVTDGDSVTGCPITLFGPDAAESWTAVAMRRFKLLADKLSAGRLKWVLSTALPIGDHFRLYFNGDRVAPTRQEMEPERKWRIGAEDDIAERIEGIKVLGGSEAGISIEGLGPVYGTVALYSDKLTPQRRASDGWSRNHGIFVFARKRLLNLDDPLFGLKQLSHGAFARFRMVVYADGLDTYLLSTREGVRDTRPVQRLRDYMLAKFNEVRIWYEAWMRQGRKGESLAARVNLPPRSLLELPLLVAVRLAAKGSASGLQLTELPACLTDGEHEALIGRLERDLVEGTSFINAVRLEPLGMERKIALFDIAEGTVRVNTLHPFFVNYEDHYRNPEPFELLAVAEVLTEAYLLEQGVPAAKVRHVMTARDRLLRELVFGKQPAAPLAARKLLDNRADPDGLEEAVADALKSLGFEVSPIGGSSEPDGIAQARLGHRATDENAREDYKFTYEAKSTSSARVSARTVAAADVARHKEKYKADHALVVAPGYDAEDDKDSALAGNAELTGITVIRAADLAALVLCAATRRLGFSRFREFLASCRSPAESRAWVEKTLNDEASPAPLPEIMAAIWELQAELPDQVTAANVQMRVREKNQALGYLQKEEIRDWMLSLSRFAPGFVEVDGDAVHLETPPERVLQHIRIQTQDIGEQYKRWSIYAGLDQVMDGADHGE